MINVFNIIKEVANEMESANMDEFYIAKSKILKKIIKLIDDNKEVIIDEYKEMTEQ
jgi:hypothetical protein